MLRELKQLEPSDFPPLLREIPDAPKRLYLRGELPPSEYKWLAVVGSRACTSYGRRVVQYLIDGLRGYPVVIVSGLAYGMDTEAHRAALSAGLLTVAVPGSGLDWSVLYPKANHALAQEILEKGGAHLSEEQPTARAMHYMFPKRNRIMAGMTHATLMVEAKGKSGSLITAKLTAEYNRELLVVPGSIFSEESKGTHQFLRMGATAVTSPEDILVAPLQSAAAAVPASPQRTTENLRELSRSAVRQALEESRGNISEAARRLGISRQTLYRKLSEGGRIATQPVGQAATASGFPG
ncbi:MAG: DNA processing protein [Parcubacteria group bacterium Athens0416_74]|nr:MAG: DNA processing protein [Parcubacteria group bacterium Athens0416_74]